MGSSTSILWGSESTAPDPATGLTARQKKIVQSTWAVVRKDPIVNGVAIMIAYFKEHPDYQKLFSGFKDVPLEELPGNKRFQAHCQSIMSALSNVIDAMGDPSLLEATLGAIGERHHRRGQTKKQFFELKDVVMEVLKQKFGSKFTAEVEEAWSKILDAAFTGMFSAVPAV
ncbi:globin [Copidosoma floridanum]|uniref:globin n=1 Tax=Copidosoma floridanum TaxID=29053 RepID=UPI0006C9C35D|nr:globin [Copidosoma floridanum]